VADTNEGTGVTTVTNHRTYNSFGTQISETNAAVDFIFGETGKMLEEHTMMNNHINRWLRGGQWLSEDPIDFDGGDANLRRMTGNDPVNHTDPTGLIPPEDADFGVGETVIGIPNGTKVRALPGRNPITAGVFYWFKWSRAGTSRIRQNDARIGMAVARLTEKGEVEIGFLVERKVLRELTRSERSWWGQTANACYGKRWTTTTEVIWVTTVKQEFRITEKWIATWKETAAALLAIKIDRGATEDVLANFEAAYDFIIPVGGRLSREAILDGKITEDAVFEAIFDGFTLAAFARIAKSGKLARLQEIEVNIAARQATKEQWKWYFEQMRLAVATNEERLLTKLEWTVIEEFGEDSVGAARKARCPKNPHLDGHTPEPGTRGTGVRRAIELEVKLVRAGKGTLKWTKEEIEYIKRTGTLPDGIVGHHINDVHTWPDWAGDPRNIRFVRGRPGNLGEHGGNYRNPTTGELIDREKMLPKPKKDGKS
jgi:RHS repeat-associated protein